MKTCKRKYLKSRKDFNYRVIRKDGGMWYATSIPVLCNDLSDWLIITDHQIIKVGFSKKVANGKKDWRKSLREIVD